MSKALAYYGDPSTEETEKFTLMMDSFFDCLNGRSKTAYIRLRKPNLKPYTERSDERLDVSYDILETHAVIILTKLVAGG